MSVELDERRRIIFRKAYKSLIGQQTTPYQRYRIEVDRAEGLEDAGVIGLDACNEMIEVAGLEYDRAMREPEERYDRAIRRVW